MQEAKTFSKGQADFPGAQSGVVLAAPLIARGEAVGLLELLDTQPARRFSEADLSLTRAIGNVVGNALENARLYAILLRRVAQLEAAYNDLQEADRLKARWIQNVSHELRAPLTSLMGYIDLVLKGDFGLLTPDQRQELEVMADKSRQLSRLIEGVLTIQPSEEEPLD